MHINCVICSDLFIPNAEVVVTPCGHMFHYHCLMHWLERSKTCPQCRNKVIPSIIHRVYFNVANSEGINEDSSVLQNKIDSLEFQIKLKDQSIQNLKQKYGKAKKQNEGLRMEVTNLEDAERSYKSAILGLKDQVQFFKNNAKDCEKLNQEIIQLNNKIKTLENVDVAIKGTRKEVDDIIRNQASIESLSLLAATLKKSLVDSDRKKRELQYQLKQIQTTHTTCERQISKFKSESEETKREMELLKENYIKEIQFLKSKFAQLDNQSGSRSDSFNKSVQRILTESPVNFNRTPILKSNPHSNTCIDLTNSPDTSLTNVKNVKPIDSDSPYLRVKPDSLGILNNIQSKGPSSLNESNKFSIFKHSTRVPEKKPCSSDIMYNGLGGSSKEDIFPSPKIKSTASGVKRKGSSTVSSLKFKKLSSNTGKIKDFF